MHNESDYHFLLLAADGVAFGLDGVALSLALCAMLRLATATATAAAAAVVTVSAGAGTVHALHASRIGYSQSYSERQCRATVSMALTQPKNCWKMLPKRARYNSVPHSVYCEVYRQLDVFGTKHTLSRSLDSILASVLLGEHTKCRQFTLRVI